ncbi:MAG TPA: oxidoreductase, partial [Terriglobales bacterium]
GPGYQTPFAGRIRREASVATAAVGLITEPMQSDQIVRTGEADMVLLARQFLRDPYFPLHAAPTLHVKAQYPVQYERASN